MPKGVERRNFMSNCYSVLLDTVSIQKYIFQSNKLKENLGASFLVESIFQQKNTKIEDSEKNDPLFDLKTVITDIFFPQQFTHLDHWKTNPEKLFISEKPVEIAYIGGGNALLFFQDEDKAIEFIKTWTRNLLIYAPGIQTAVALNKFDFNQKVFRSERKKLARILDKNQQNFTPQTIIPQHGITAECTRSGYSMDVWNEKTADAAYVSSVTNAKILGAKKSNDAIHLDYQQLLNFSPVKGKTTSFRFPDQLDDLGCIKSEDNIIAIVHIDGNGMGDQFNQIESLEAFRKLSIDVDKATKSAFRKLLSQIINRYDEIMDELGFDLSGKNAQRSVPTDKEGRRLLPIRPIILGGDDITFVCAGKLGIYFSELFLEYFAQEKVRDNIVDLTACAGVVMTKTAYPFYRGYNLAEELCSNAKRVRVTEGNQEGSYIDFHVSSGGFSGSLKDIREHNYTVAQGNLVFRPYQLGSDKTNPRSYQQLLENVREMSKMPNSKIHQLREVLTQSEGTTIQYLKQLKYRKESLPQFTLLEGEETFFYFNPPKDKQHKKDDHSSKKEFMFTPYYDMIELMANYPVNFLPKQGDEK